MFHDSTETSTSRHQFQLEQAVREIYAQVLTQSSAHNTPALDLDRSAHVRYLHSGLQRLPSGYVSLDASRPWICYWILQSLALLGAPLPAKLGLTEVAKFLRSCQASTGGFGGGPRQVPHLAPSYASVAALVTLGGEAALGMVNRQGMQHFLQAMAVPAAEGGGFRVCQGGEVDVRGCYTAMAIAHMLGLDKANLAVRANMGDYLRTCQTYEGGIGGEPGSEAHGGYTYCGLAAACLAGCTHMLDMPALHSWAVSMQGEMEGGFKGRTNKLVDGCYSFWQGSLSALIQTDIATHAENMHASESRTGESTVHRDIGNRKPWQQAQDLVTRARQAADAAQVAADEAVRHAFAQVSEPTQPAENNTVPDGTAVTQSPSPEALTKAADAQQGAQRAANSLEAAKVSAVMLCPSKLQQQDMQHSIRGAAALSAGMYAAPLQHLCHRLTQHNADEQPMVVAFDGQCAIQSDDDHVAENSLVLDIAIGLQSSCEAHNSLALQLWILAACQGPHGGLRDKPGKPPDYYHTCYCLSGLAIAQHSSGLVLGQHGNVLKQTDPLCNVLCNKLAAARAFFLG